MVGDRESTSGIIHLLGGRSLVAWQSHKQHVIVLSPCEAEYIAGAASSGRCCKTWWAPVCLRQNQ